MEKTATVHIKTAIDKIIDPRTGRSKFTAELWMSHNQKVIGEKLRFGPFDTEKAATRELERQLSMLTSEIKQSKPSIRVVDLFSSGG